jgi:hypothetical protein
MQKSPFYEMKSGTKKSQEMGMVKVADMPGPQLIQTAAACQKPAVYEQPKGKKDNAKPPGNGTPHNPNDPHRSKLTIKTPVGTSLHLPCS